jgi:hypothetical protein
VPLRFVSYALFLSGSAIFVVLGLAHGLLTLRDLASPRSFTPTDPAVRDAMAKAPLAFAPQTTVWQSWLGFNLSHSLGLLVFGAVFGAVALRDFAWLQANPFLRFTPVAVSLVYAILAVRFWFWAPALASALGCACLFAAAILG